MKVLLTKSFESVATSLVGEEETSESVWFHSKLICASSVHFNILNTITCLGCKLMMTMNKSAFYAACAVRVTIFSTGEKFCPVAIFT